MPTMSDQFAAQVMRIAVAQILRHDDFGRFDSCEGHAFQLLVDVVGKYIERIGQLARRYAEHDRRTESGLLDLLQAFEKLTPNRVDWHDLERTCREVPWQVPATSGVPDFPVDHRKRRAPYGEPGAAGGSSSNSNSSSSSSSSSSGGSKPGEEDDGEEWTKQKRQRLGDAAEPGATREHPVYVPDHLPDFPERHTYARTEVDATVRLTDRKAILERNDEETRRVQLALGKIHKTQETSVTHSFGAMEAAVSPPADAKAPPLAQAFLR